MTNDRLKLINARMVDVEHDRYFDPGVSLIVENGQIAAMPGLPGQPADVPAEAVVDLHGLTVIPGLFNTHCHLQFLERSAARARQITKNLGDCLARGVTHVRDTLCFDLEENQAWMAKVARGEIRGPRIHQAIHVSPLGGTYAPHQTPISRYMLSLLGLPTIPYGAKRSGVVVFQPNASAQAVRDAVDRAIDERGATVVKLCDQPEKFMTYAPGAKVMSPAQLEAAVDQAARRGRPTTMHTVTVAGFRQGVQAGVTSFAHLPMDGDLTEADVRQLLSAGTHIEPTLSVGYYMSYSMRGSPVAGHPEIQRLDRLREESYDRLIEETWLPELQTFHKGMHTSLRQGEMKVFGLIDLSGPFRYMSKFIPVGGKNLQRLVEHGAASRLGCGTDAGAANCSAAFINLELRLFDFLLNREAAPRCFTAADALRMATLQSARAMGVEAHFGSLRPGKAADLAVLEGDPLQDYRLIGQPVQALFMEGKLVVNRCGLQVAGANGGW